MFSQGKKSTYSICSKCYIQTQTEKKKIAASMCLFVILLNNGKKKQMNEWTNRRRNY